MEASYRRLQPESPAQHSPSAHVSDKPKAEAALRQYLCCYMSTWCKAARAQVRVFTKKTGAKPDFSEPVVLSADRGGTTVQHLCDQLHRSLAKEFKCAGHTCWLHQLQRQSMPICMTPPCLGQACCRAIGLILQQ